MLERYHSACTERERADDEGGWVHEHECSKPGDFLGGYGAVVVTVIVVGYLGAETTEVNEDAAVDYYKGAFDDEEPHVVIEEAFTFVSFVDPALSHRTVSDVWILRQWEESELTQAPDGTGVKY